MKTYYGLKSLCRCGKTVLKEGRTYCSPRCTRAAFKAAYSGLVQRETARLLVANASMRKSGTIGPKRSFL